MLPKWLRRIGPCLLPLALVGCYRATATTSLPKADRHTTTGHLYLFGMVGQVQVDVRDYCGERPAAEVRMGGSIVTTVATVATLGIYSPRRVRITCAEEAAP